MDSIAERIKKQHIKLYIDLYLEIVGDRARKEAEEFITKYIFEIHENFEYNRTTYLVNAPIANIGVAIDKVKEELERKDEDSKEEKRKKKIKMYLQTLYPYCNMDNLTPEQQEAKGLIERNLDEIPKEMMLRCDISELSYRAKVKRTLISLFKKEQSIKGTKSSIKNEGEER